MTGGLKKRFIAGALCPACSAQDRIRTWSEEGLTHRECVACGYADSLDERGNPQPKELPTRVNHGPRPVGPEDASIQVVRFFPNPKAKKSAQ